MFKWHQLVFFDISPVPKMQKRYFFVQFTTVYCYTNKQTSKQFNIDMSNIFILCIGKALSRFLIESLDILSSYSNFTWTSDRIFFASPSSSLCSSMQVNGECCLTMFVPLLHHNWRHSSETFIQHHSWPPVMGMICIQSPTKVH